MKTPQCTTVCSQPIATGCDLLGGIPLPYLVCKSMLLVIYFILSDVSTVNGILKKQPTLFYP